MSEKTTEDIIRYQCDGPNTRQERQQIRARARAAAQEKLNQEEAEKAAARRAEIEAPVDLQHRKAA
jgi:hypothetical protein